MVPRHAKLAAYKCELIGLDLPLAGLPLGLIIPGKN
jgi:hypothetical protein